MLARLIAWLNFFIPLIAVTGAYAIAIHQELAVACIPLWEGCTSISRAARYGDALFWFRGFMMPLSMLLVIYWIFQRQWLNALTGKRRRHDVILVLGVISALALVLYANYLGSDGGVYRFMRRFGVTFYFTFAVLAQLISLQSLHSICQGLDSGTRRLLRGQWALVSVLWAMGLVSLGFDIVRPEYKFEADNIIEWNFGLGMIAFYALSALLWRKRPPASVSLSARLYRSAG